MDTKPSPRSVRVEIDSVGPIGGWIGDDEPQRARFDGWLQLISLLERVAAGVGAPPTGPIPPATGDRRPPTTPSPHPEGEGHT